MKSARVDHWPRNLIDDKTQRGLNLRCQRWDQKAEVRLQIFAFLLNFREDVHCRLHLDPSQGVDGFIVDGHEHVTHVRAPSMAQQLLTHLARFSVKGIPEALALFNILAFSMREARMVEGKW